MTRATFEEVTTDEPHKPLTERLVRRAGRNSQGKLTVRHQGSGHKRLYRVIDWKRDRGGKAQHNSVRLTISKELPASFRLPGKQPINEQVFYHLLTNFLQALTQNGVAVCGGPGVQPLAGRTETVGPRN